MLLCLLKFLRYLNRMFLYPQVLCFAKFMFLEKLIVFFYIKFKLTNIWILFLHCGVQNKKHMITKKKYKLCYIVVTWVKIYNIHLFLYKMYIIETSYFSFMYVIQHQTIQCSNIYILNRFGLVEFGCWIKFWRFDWIDFVWYIWFIIFQTFCLVNLIF